MFELFLSALIEGFTNYTERQRKAQETLDRINARVAEQKAARRAQQIERENAACQARQKVEKVFEKKAQRARSSEIEAKLFRESAKARGTRYEQAVRQQRTASIDRQLRTLFGDEE